MKYKTLIILGIVIVAVIIIYVVWSKSKTERLAMQAERDKQLAQMAAQQSATSGVTPWSTAIDSAGNLIDSLSGLFGKGDKDSPPASQSAQAIQTHSENCQEMYPNDAVKQQACMDAYPNYQ